MFWFIRMTLTLISFGVLAIGLYRSDLNTIFAGIIFAGFSIFMNTRWSRRGIEQRQLSALEKMSRRYYQGRK